MAKMTIKKLQSAYFKMNHSYEWRLWQQRPLGWPWCTHYLKWLKMGMLRMLQMMKWLKMKSTKEGIQLMRRFKSLMQN